ncbi:MAG: hypothetical protein QUS07_02200 [Methanothrix sp.]|nr:hypothetical protein [Methanothrix sp.]
MDEIEYSDDPSKKVAMPLRFCITITIEKHKSSYDIVVFGEGILHLVFVESLLDSHGPSPSFTRPLGGWHSFSTTTQWYTLSGLDVRDKSCAENRISCAAMVGRSFLRSKLDLFSNPQPMASPGTHANELISTSHAD